MEAKELTAEEKQRNLYKTIVRLAKKGRTKTVNGTKYKEIKCWLPIEVIPEIEGWAEK
ncbi:hypothetical protein [Ezakiella peruensis]|uniref:hypothetical protein n=1 Tax=Ezakiella peruensis TaxID=1464038 RepID=UPI0014737674|nr:hypothetical protein [Ezakiella peruensis]